MLGIPGIDNYRNFYDLKDLSPYGDSLLRASGMQSWEMIGPDDDGSDVVMVVHTNQHDHISRITTTVVAESFRDAVRKIYDLIAPLLSEWSFRYDVPIDTRLIHIRDETTRDEYVEYQLFGAVQDFDIQPLDRRHPMVRALLSAYREGLNSLDPAFQLISFWRVVEGCQEFRDLRFKQVGRNRSRYTKPSERIPASVELLPPDYRLFSEGFEPYLGKTFNDVIKRDITPNYRHIIAHLNPLSPMSIADVHGHRGRVERIVPVARYMSRVMLEHELGLVYSGGPPQVDSEESSS